MVKIAVLIPCYNEELTIKKVNFTIKGTIIGEKAKDNLKIIIDSN